MSSGLSTDRCIHLGCKNPTYASIEVFLLTPQCSEITGRRGRDSDYPWGWIVISKTDEPDKNRWADLTHFYADTITFVAKIDESAVVKFAFIDPNQDPLGFAVLFVRLHDYS